MDAIPVVEICDVPYAGEPAGTQRRIGTGSRATEMRRERRQPRLFERRLDHVEQRPDGSLRQPGIRLSVEADSRGDGPVDEPPRERELDVRADTVRPA